MTYHQERIKPYKDSSEDKKTQVRRMFDHIAPTYDSLNHTLSLGIDRLWRRKAIKALDASHPGSILDLATGTGDFAILLARAFPKSLVQGVDISEGMMEVARKKTKDLGLDPRVSFQVADACEMPFQDGSFDAVTIAFGARNFEDLDRSLKECQRILRPGGRLIILELSYPEHFPLRQLYWLYTKTIMPLTGRLISHDDSAYTYLPDSIKACPQGKEMEGIILKAGFASARHEYLSMGLCGLYEAVKH